MNIRRITEMVICLIKSILEEYQIQDGTVSYWWCYFAKSYN